MANRERGEKTLVAGDRRLTCRLTTNSCAEVEDFSGGRTWQQVWSGVQLGSAANVRLFFWVALRERHPDIATDNKACLKVIGDIIDDAGGLRSDGLSTWVADFILLNSDQAKSDEGKTGSGGKPEADPPAAQVEVTGVVSTETLVSSV